MDNKICSEVSNTMNTRNKKMQVVEPTNYIRTQSGGVIAIPVTSPANEREKKKPPKNAIKPDDKQP